MCTYFVYIHVIYDIYTRIYMHMYIYIYIYIYRNPISSPSGVFSICSLTLFRVRSSRWGGSFRRRGSGQGESDREGGAWHGAPSYTRQTHGGGCQYRQCRQSFWENSVGPARITSLTSRWTIDVVTTAPRKPCRRPITSWRSCAGLSSPISARNARRSTRRCSTRISRSGPGTGTRAATSSLATMAGILGALDIFRRQLLAQGLVVCGSQAFIATLLFDPSMSALPLIEAQKSPQSFDVVLPAGSVGLSYRR